MPWVLQRMCWPAAQPRVCFIQVFYFVLHFVLFWGVLLKHFPRISFGMWVVYRGLWFSLLWSLNKLISFIENKKNKRNFTLYFLKYIFVTQTSFFVLVFKRDVNPHFACQACSGKKTTDLLERLNEREPALIKLFPLSLSS